MENTIIQATIDAEDRKTTHKNIDTLALLKAEATKVHLKCITQTLEVLTE